MNLETCLKKMELVGVLAFATIRKEHRRSGISVPFIMKRMRYIFLLQGEKISAESFRRMAGYRFCVIPDTRK